MKAVRIHKTGGPEVLVYEDAPDPKPAAGEALVRVEAAGVNFIDVYYRSGLYKAAALPYTPGMEAAGTVAALGEGVAGLKVGERVAYAMNPGSYAEYAAVPAWKLVKLPEAVDAKQGAAAMLQGMTAHYLSHSTFPLKPGHKALVHAGAGGVGLLLTQLARRLGATVYTTVGTEAKAEASRAAGAHEAILYTKADFGEEVKRLTGGKGVDVVYDSVGVSTFAKSLDCLRPRGMMVLYGQSSGPVPPVETGLLAAKGSLFLTRPSLAAYAADKEELAWRAGDLFKWMAAGELTLKIDRTFPLAEASQAHAALEGRKTSGKVLLIP
ncbi:quinone oxidoreductase [bacterium]|nr:MAG: quinone oxidoreductase [bacterium]